jgi:hypothetical protein
MIGAIILIVIGVLSLGYQGFTYTTRERVIDAGPLKVDVDKEHHVPIAPIVGGVALAGGVALLLIGGRKSA